MRRLFVILGLTTSILAVALSVTRYSNISYIPALAALIFGLVAFYLSRQKQYPKKSIQLIFMLTIISLSITTYKVVFDDGKVNGEDGLELKEAEPIEQSLQELEGTGI